MMESRTSFTPDALARFAALFEEVWSELVLTRVVEPDADATRPGPVWQSAFSGLRWSDSQIRQLLMCGPPQRGNPVTAHELI